MAKSDKTDKPKDAQSEDQLKDKTQGQDLEEAEIVDDVTSQSDEPSEQDTVETDPVALDEPETAVETSDDNPSDVDDAGMEQGAVAEAPEQTSSSGGFWPLLMGGALAAGIGFGGATYLGSQGILFGGNADEIGALTAKLDTQANEIANLRSSQTEMTAAAQQAEAGIAEATARAAALSDRVEEMGTKLQALEGRLIESEKRPMTEGASSAAMEAYEREVEQLRALVSEQLEEAETLKQNSARTARETMAQAAMTRVITALDSGAPYRAALTELAGTSGVAIPEALSLYADNGVPTNLALVDVYPDYARVALADARKHEQGDSGSRLGHFLKSQLGARSTTPQEGGDADAILSRAEAALKEGRLQAALDELTALPESSQALMADWRTSAEARLAATAAAETLAQSLNSN